MKLSIWIGGTTFGLHVLATAIGAGPRDINVNEGRIIPLDQIWAYKMPGTHNVSKDAVSEVAKLAEEIRSSLTSLPPQGKEANEGFAVAGQGIDALREARSVLVEGRKPTRTLPPNRDVSVVFFSHQFGFYVHLVKVVQRANTIEIQYRFVPHKSKELSEHFALIPIGKMPASKLKVNVTQLPMTKEFLNAGFKPIKPDAARRIVCKSFSFDIEKGERSKNIPEQ